LERWSRCNGGRDGWGSRCSRLLRHRTKLELASTATPGTAPGVLENAAWLAPGACDVFLSMLGCICACWGPQTAKCRSQAGLPPLGN